MSRQRRPTSALLVRPPLLRGHEDAATRAETTAYLALVRAAVAASAAERPPMTAEKVVRQAEAEGLTLVKADNISGYTGVSFERNYRAKPYQAKVQCRGGTQVVLGYFATAEEAALSIARTAEGRVAASAAAAPPRARSRKRPLDASSSRMPPPSHAASADAPTLEDAPTPPSPPSWPAAGEASDPISQARGELVEALCKLQSRCVRHPRSVPSAASGEGTMVQPHQTIYVLTPHTGSGFWMGPLGWDLGARRPPGMGPPGVGSLVSI